MQNRLQVVNVTTRYGLMSLVVQELELPVLVRALEQSTEVTSFTVRGINVANQPLYFGLPKEDFTKWLSIISE